MNGKEAAWATKTVAPYTHPHPRFCELMSDVATGRKDKEEAWQEWVAFCAANGMEPVQRKPRAPAERV